MSKDRLVTTEVIIPNNHNSPGLNTIVETGLRRLVELDLVSSIMPDAVSYLSEQYYTHNDFDEERYYEIVSKTLGTELIITPTQFGTTIGVRKSDPRWSDNIMTDTPQITTPILARLDPNQTTVNKFSIN